MKGLFKSKPKSPVEVVRQSSNLLASLHSNAPDFRGTKREEKARKDATQVVANLQRQLVESRLIAPVYLEENFYLLDILISGHVLESGNLSKFFDYIKLPNFDIAADATENFRELLTRNKSTVAAFLSKNFDWFVREYNTKLLESNNYVTRRQALKTSSVIHFSCWVTFYSDVMVHYVSSKDNLRILMNLLKLFVANENKPPDIMNVLIANQTKLLRFFAEFKLDKENEQFEEDKALLIKEIARLEPMTNHGQL